MAARCRGASRTKRSDWRAGARRRAVACGVAWAVVGACQALQKRWTDLEATLAAAESAVPGNLGPHYQAARAILCGEERSGARRGAAAPLSGHRARDRTAFTRAPTGAPDRRSSSKEEGRGDRAELQTALKLDQSLAGAKKDLKRLKG